VERDPDSGGSGSGAAVDPAERIRLLRAFIKEQRRVMSREVVPNHLLYILIGVALFVPSTILVYVAPGIRRWFVPVAVVFIGGLIAVYVVSLVRAGFRLGKMKDDLDDAEEELRRLEAGRS
jgi:hypothetical protein